MVENGLNGMIDKEKKMKDIYETPELDLREFSEDDIIRTSTEETGHEDEGEWSW